MRETDTRQAWDGIQFLSGFTLVPRQALPAVHLAKLPINVRVGDVAHELMTLDAHLEPVSHSDRATSAAYVAQIYPGQVVWVDVLGRYKHLGNDLFISKNLRKQVIP